LFYSFHDWFLVETWKFCFLNSYKHWLVLLYI
jgi:hypothetical protein